MRYLLDTNVISGLMRKRLEIRTHLSSLGPAHDIVTCPIVRGEILFGIEKLPQGRRREQLAERATAALAEARDSRRRIRPKSKPRASVRVPRSTRTTFGSLRQRRR
jgi:predicted nucleic acid-binding protein